MHELEAAAFENLSGRRLALGRLLNNCSVFVAFGGPRLCMTWQWICDDTFPKDGGAVSIPQYDDWTIDRWRLEPRLNGLEIDDPPDSGVAPALWKDLTLALAVAAALWMTAAIVFG